ncbi:MAG: hypothetical protein VX278_03920, partial [Myxococcota bacterium]|nr:hypothetical protein [Myxococcota bacterium]
MKFLLLLFFVQFSGLSWSEETKSTEKNDGSKTSTKTVAPPNSPYTDSLNDHNLPILNPDGTFTST